MRFTAALKWLAKPSARIVGTSVLAGLVVVFASPADGDTGGLVAKISSAVNLSSAPSHEGTPFAGTSAVGALFSESGGTLGSHFCTASVVHSTGGDLLVTAAHCVSGHTGTIAFVPGYANGKSPYGVWYVSQIFVDQAWTSSGSINDDVAFLQVKPNSMGTEIEDVTGAEQLGSSEAGQLTEVIGYPDSTNAPVVCANQTKSFTVPSTGSKQLEFDCGNYPDGTSGGPFLVNVNKTTGQGTVTGVIGGYEQGGNYPQVSYSIPFGKQVSALYKAAAS
ncbi:MAG: trypsin-like serine protease [Actinobacteria bacterium]|nr:trypsin-like serine protease [Actinomycetota bacterium]